MKNEFKKITFQVTTLKNIEVSLNKDFSTEQRKALNREGKGRGTENDYEVVKRILAKKLSCKPEEIIDLEIWGVE
jgi:hypothetical protein